MKKKIIIINIILIIAVLVGIEFSSFKMTERKNLVFKAKADRLESNRTRSYVTKYRLFKDFDVNIYGKSSKVEDSDKKPLILFGCSYAEGAGLADDNVPCARLSKLTGRTCINRSRGATGTQFMYWQLKNENFDIIAPDVDYIVYIYINNHIQRLYNWQINPLIDMFNLRYKINKEGKLEEIKPFFKPVFSSFAFRRFMNKKINEQARQEWQDYKLFNAIMKETAEILREKYPNAKFIMLEYPDLTDGYLPDYEINRLESYGITVAKATELAGGVDLNQPQYWLADKIHPSDEAWDLIMPAFVKKYIK